MEKFALKKQLWLSLFKKGQLSKNTKLRMLGPPSSSERLGKGEKCEVSYLPWIESTWSSSEGRCPDTNDSLLDKFCLCFSKWRGGFCIVFRSVWFKCGGKKRAESVIFLLIQNHAVVAFKIHLLEAKMERFIA